MLLNIKLRQQADEALELQRRFQELVADIATDFIGVGSVTIDAGINRALQLTGEFFGVDQSDILTFYRTEEGLVARVTHEWCREGQPSSAALIHQFPIDDMPVFRQKMLVEKSILHVPGVDHLPFEAVNERALLQRHGIKSSLSVPIYTDKIVYGAIGFEARRQEVFWSGSQIHGLKVIAQVLATAFASIEVEKALMDAKANLELRVRQRTAELTEQVTAKEKALADLSELQNTLMEVSRAAGMAEVATGVLHNVGNVLNSVNVSCDLLMEKLQGSRLMNVARVAGLLEANRERLAEFITTDERGRNLPGYLSSLAATLEEERRFLQHETGALSGRIGHIKEIVAMQQNYGRVPGVLESILPKTLMEEALKLNAGVFSRHDIRVDRQYQNLPPIVTDRHRVLQILLNLIHNAKYACCETDRSPRVVVLRTLVNVEGSLCLQVEDNGIGIPRENITRIFQHGFTTRRDGHGFGLHIGALTARDLGGSLMVHSDGPGHGAVFTLELPFTRDT
ncbi:putative sensory box histidine kinase/response regulator [Ectothiorhodospira sp. PHS-1]|uniref:ATP-binding protein n=1 Tax=Ectothiorhodospira sp. PHS-1 TaxID=519989 RepID=UPI00024A81E4|nr:ATP-binding protein [Ectothiorhodospira sp. PHS-1]EHQ52082.1 putative sensory box histidine kinase/response regulator [Ectothiorhodospira sp. PHS-1]